VLKTAKYFLQIFIQGICLLVYGIVVHLCGKIFHPLILFSATWLQFFCDK